MHEQNSQGPHSHILMTGEGGGSDFLGSEILAQSDFFGSMKDARNFLCRRKKQSNVFWVARKGLRDFLGMLKK